jgi:hypothetical protein
MCASNVEDLIADLDPEESKIYFDAKGVLVSAEDSNNERFATAARIVRAFWKRVALRSIRSTDQRKGVITFPRRRNTRN